MSVYAIKVWLSKSEKDWFLYKDLEDNVVHTWSRKEKAEEVMNLLTCNKAEITEEIPPPALARSTEKKQRLKTMKKKVKKKQGYNARKDESMGMKSGKESSKKMSMASRRKVAKATRKPKGTYGFKK